MASFDKPQILTSDQKPGFERNVDIDYLRGDLKFNQNKTINR